MNEWLSRFVQPSDKFVKRSRNLLSIKAGLLSMSIGSMDGVSFPLQFEVGKCPPLVMPFKSTILRRSTNYSFCRDNNDVADDR